MLTTGARGGGGGRGVVQRQDEQSGEAGEGRWCSEEPKQESEVVASHPTFKRWAI